jgi:hypothetical protein
MSDYCARMPSLRGTSLKKAGLLLLAPTMPITNERLPPEADLLISSTEVPGCLISTLGPHTSRISSTVPAKGKADRARDKFVCSICNTCTINQRSCALIEEGCNQTNGGWVTLAGRHVAKRPGDLIRDPPRTGQSTKPLNPRQGRVPYQVSLDDETDRGRLQRRARAACLAPTTAVRAGRRRRRVASITGALRRTSPPLSLVATIPGCYSVFDFIF